MSIRKIASWPARFGVVVAVVGTALVASGTAGYAAPATATAVPTTGPPGAVISLTAPANTYKTVAGVSKLATGVTAVQFQTTVCATGAGVIPSAGISRVVGNTDGTTTQGSTAISETGAAFATADVGRVISGTGIPPGATIVTAPTATTATISAPAVSSQTTSDFTITAAPFNAASYTVVSSSRLIVRAPALAASATGVTYNICVYDSGAGAAAVVLSQATYKVYAAPSITAITPASGPALGENQVVISGTGFTNTAKATVGGVALTNLVVSTTAGTITGTVASHASGTADVVVTTEGGPVTLTNGYTYSNGITVTPKTTTLTSPVVLDVLGAGFNSMSFLTTDGTTPRDVNAHVLLVLGGSYAKAATTTTGAAIAECTNVVVITDTELICNYDPANPGTTFTATPVGAYQVMVINNTLAAAATPIATIVTSASTFTVASY